MIIDFLSQGETCWNVNFPLEYLTVNQNGLPTHLELYQILSREVAAIKKDPGSESAFVSSDAPSESPVTLEGSERSKALVPKTWKCQGLSGKSPCGVEGVWYEEFLWCDSCRRFLCNKCLKDQHHKAQGHKSEHHWNVKALTSAAYEKLKVRPSYLSSSYSPIDYRLAKKK